MFELFENPTLDRLLQEREGQLFDRKSGRIDHVGLINRMIGFANADGGVIAIGIEKDKTVRGVEDVTIKAERIRKGIVSLIMPPIKCEIKLVPCKNFKGEEANLLLVEIPQGSEVYSNLKDEVFLRIGEENMKLNHKQRSLLLDDRGMASFEATDVRGATITDIESDAFEEYKQIMKLPNIPTEELILGRNLARRNNQEIVINVAGIILFGKEPEKWIERAKIRILRYEGKGEETGESFNVTKDISIYGPLSHQIKKVQEVLGSMLREFTALDPSGRFITEAEYPDFAWKEVIINAVVHRSYAMRGADIQIKMFDDHLDVVSPGKFPGFVNEKNIKDTHYSRNPRIARVVSELGYIRELGEGVDRIIKLTKAANLPPPLFTEKTASEVLVRLENNIYLRTPRKKAEEIEIKLDKEVLQSLSSIERKIINFVSEYERISTRECEKLIRKHRVTASRHLSRLAKNGILGKVGKVGPKIHYILGKKLMFKGNGTDEESRDVNGQRPLF